MMINVIVGVRVAEISPDLTLLGAAISSFKDQPLRQDLVVFGGGRCDPTGQQRSERLKEVAQARLRQRFL